MADVTISQSCVCGASITVINVDKANKVVKRWAKKHIHNATEGPNGSYSQAERRPEYDYIGFRPNE